jgi:hypothetical protein
VTKAKPKITWDEVDVIRHVAATDHDHNQIQKAADKLDTVARDLHKLWESVGTRHSATRDEAIRHLSWVLESAMMAVRHSARNMRTIGIGMPNSGTAYAEAMAEAGKQRVTDGRHPALATLSNTHDLEDDAD